MEKSQQFYEALAFTLAFGVVILLALIYIIQILIKSYKDGK